MPVELRKRKAPAPPPEPPAKKQQSKVAKVAKVADKIKEAVKPRGRPAKTEPAAAPATNGSSTAGKPQVGDTISLDGFGGEIETNEGVKTSLKALVDESKAGVVLFTYPKASTPGCTTQVCLFRDSYGPLTAGGLAIYGLSSDSLKANTTFKEKQKLPYPLLCDPSATLIGAIGLKKAPKGTTRGVFVVDKQGKVLVAEAGGPAATLAAVKKIVEELAGGDTAAAVDGIPAPADAAEEAKAEPATADKAEAPAIEKAPADAPAPMDGPTAENKDEVMTDAPNGNVKTPAPAEEKSEIVEKKDE